MNTQPVVRRIAEVPANKVENARGSTLSVILGADQGMPHFYTRQFVIQPGGRIPCHRHDTIEHEQVVLEGEMQLTLGDETRTVRAGDSIYIPAKLAHAYENRGNKPVVFICIVPATADYKTEWLEAPAA